MINNPFAIKPTRIILQGDKELAAGYSGESKRILFQLKNIQKTSPYTQELTKKYEDGTIINVHSKVSGMDVVSITSGRLIKEQKEIKYVERTRKYIAPAFLCYSFIQNETDKYGKPEMFAIFKDLKTIEYVYKPTKLDERSMEMAETFDIVFEEFYDQDYIYGSANKTIITNGEFFSKKVEIKEIYNSYGYPHDKIVFNKDGEFDITYSDGGHSGQGIGYSDTSIEVFGNTAQDCHLSLRGLYKSDGELIYYMEWESHGTECFPDDKNVVNPLVPTNGTKNFSHESNAYMYSYSIDTIDVSMAGLDPPLDWTDEGNSYNNVPVLYEFFLRAVCNSTKAEKQYDVTVKLFDISAHHIDLIYNDTVDHLIFDYNGEPVFIFGYNPKAYIIFEDEYIKDDIFYKIHYIMIYKGNVYKTSQSFDDLSIYGVPHILYDDNNKSVVIDGKQYYASGDVRCVEVTETIREIVR